MKKLILDTSVMVKWFSEEKSSIKARKLLEDLEKEKVEILLPELAKYELANALLKGKKLNYTQSQKALKVFYSLPLTFTNDNLKLAKMSYKLAEKLKITYYDACFLALAKECKATLITANPKHQRKPKGIKVASIQ